MIVWDSERLLSERDGNPGESRGGGGAESKQKISFGDSVAADLPCSKFPLNPVLTGAFALESGDGAGRSTRSDSRFCDSACL